MTYEDIVKSIEEGKHFTFLRIGDGEMLCADGVSGENCDGHRYYPDLGKAIFSVLKRKRENIVMGLQPDTHGLYHNKAPYPQEWVNADVLHNQSEKGGLVEFMDALKGKDVTIVGASHLKELGFNRIPTPNKNAWLQYETIQKKVEKVAKKGNQVILFSCGMLKVPLIEWVSRTYPNNTYIDTGSVFDPYCGVNSRSYHKKVDTKLI